ncbi:HAD family hydrolase [Flavobacterium foetidum]|uniref:HAD family hydrolase n=1 Tax=Flavobacterium foetidum TaxID=2026681 RepID=UPI001074F09C|nr:HAD family hydrolase [Flavobacterium foetidum]KAF2513531.1 HAD family hydrolase [Flavobacterium foetidum]
MKIFFDLDGTLLDSKPRLYHLFQFLVPTSKLTFEEYWKLKKDKIPHKEILIKYFGYKDDEVLKFNTEWMELIESAEWLAYDKLFNGVKTFLEFLKSENELYLVTARQYEDVVINQIENLGLKGIFNDILVTLQKTDKEELIRNRCAMNENDWIVGDTGKDVETGKNLGIRTCAVLTGFLSNEQLLTYSPDVIVSDVTLLKF